MLSWCGGTEVWLFPSACGFDYESSKEGREDWRYGRLGDSRLARKCLPVEGGREGARGDFNSEEKVQSQNDLSKRDFE